MELQTTWFFLWGLLWAVFFMTDGFDFGIGTLYPFLGKTENEKRIMLNSVGPLWDGNEVWLITAGGVTFAAFPQVYGVMFSTLYSALMLILFALILRGVSFEFRGKVDDPRWRKVWDTCLFIGSFLPAFLFGVVFANIFQGIPFDGEGVYHGTLFTLLNPYGLLGGALFLLLFVMHGALWLAIRSEGGLQEKAYRTAGIVWPILLVAVVLFLFASKVKTELWDNYLEHPVLFLEILATVIALVCVKIFLQKKAFFKAWFSSALTIAGTTFFGIIGLYPNLFPSSIDKAFSLTAHNASSSPLTLKIMLVVVVIFIPVVIAYQVWAYTLFKHTVTEEDFTY
ncbi:MAG: cytochrome d ubiquinol oxidase subunit II [Desulfobacterales bacterium]